MRKSVLWRLHTCKRKIHDFVNFPDLFILYRFSRGESRAGCIMPKLSVTCAGSSQTRVLLYPCPAGADCMRMAVLFHQLLVCGPGNFSAIFMEVISILLCYAYFRQLSIGKTVETCVHGIHSTALLLHKVSLFAENFERITVCRMDYRHSLSGLYSPE